MQTEKNTTRRIENINLRLSEREKAIFDNEAQNARADSVSSWARSALVNYCEIHGNGTSWFFLGDFLAVIRGDKTEDVFVSDGRMALKITPFLKSRLAGEYLQTYLDNDLLKKFPLLKVIRDGDKSETLEPSEYKMDLLFEQLDGATPVTLMTNSGRPLIFFNEQIATCTFSGEKVPKIGIQYKYVRLMNELCPQNVIYKASAQAVGAFDTNGNLLAVVMMLRV